MLLRYFVTVTERLLTYPLLLTVVLLCRDIMTKTTHKKENNWLGACSQSRGLASEYHGEKHGSRQEGMGWGGVGESLHLVHRQQTEKEKLGWAFERP